MKYVITINERLWVRLYFESKVDAEYYIAWRVSDYSRRSDYKIVEVENFNTAINRT